MPLRKRAVKSWPSFNFGVSYRLGDNRSDRFLDCLNVYTSQNLLRTRPGIRRYNDTAVGTGIDSLSFFKDSTGTRRLIAKSGTVLYSVAASGAHTELKTGLTASDKHRAVTLNDRHIIASGATALAFYDGTNYSNLGLDVPSAPSVAASGSGNNLDASDYRVVCTFYASSIGAESNKGVESAILTTTAGQRIDVSSIDTTSTHPLVDKVRVYVRDYKNAGDYLFWEEISLGTATSTIDENPSSSQTVPTRNAAPPSGGATFITKFDRRLAYVGTDGIESDLIIGEQDVPDAVDDSGRGTRIFIPGDGEPTGIVTGYFDDSNQTPYIVVFKSNSTHVYSEIGGTPAFVTLSEQIGCNSGDTARVVNGDVFFLSSQKGWRVIRNGRFVKTKTGIGDEESDTIGGSDLDDLFTRKGYVYELSKSNFSNFHSVYYGTLGQYITFVSEGGNSSILRAYCYHPNIDGFYPFSLNQSIKASCVGEDSSGRETVFLGDSDGYIYTYTIQNDQYADEDRDGNELDIVQYFILSHIPGIDGDFDSTYNYHELILDAIANSRDFTVKYFPNFDLGDVNEITYSFTDPNTGFVLDVSKLDEGVFTDGRTIVRARGDLRITAKSLAVGVYLTAQGATMDLIRGQLNMKKNGKSD